MEQDTNYNNSFQQRQPQYFGESAPVMTVGNWLVTWLICCIPLINVIMLIVWASSSTENPNRKNWAISYLIIMAIGIVIWIAAWGAIAGMISSLM